MTEPRPVLRTLISCERLAARLGEPSLVVVDVRHDLALPERWGEAQYSAAHIPGAVFAHVDRDLSGPKTGRNGRHPLPAPAVAAATFGRLGIAAGKDVVVYDQGTGMYAARLWWMLRWLGHASVAVLNGGFARWQAERRPTETGSRAPEPATFEPGVADAATVDAEALVGNLASHELLVLDARAPERFRGEVEPLDAQAGHIPGAVNRPFAANLSAEGVFRPAAVLNSELLLLIGNRSPASIVHQCGSGVSACHNLLAFEHAGLFGSRLYPGSWSEWSADPSRPIE